MRERKRGERLCLLFRVCSLMLRVQLPTEDVETSATSEDRRDSMIDDVTADKADKSEKVTE